MKILLMYAPSPGHREALERAAGPARFVVAQTEAEAAREIVDADAVLGNRFFVQSVPHARRLRWMQSNSHGVDLILQSPALPRDLVLTCARGVYDEQVALHGLALVLALVRGLHLCRDSQDRREWSRISLPTLSGFPILVLGWGGIGRTLGGWLQSLGAAVQGVRRRHTGPPRPDERGIPIRGPADWRDELPRTRMLIMALPLTPETHRMVGPAEISQMSPSSFVVNIGRGGTLDDSALLGAIRQGHLSGAALDVFEEEPLPPSHQAWSTPRLLVSPHLGRSPEAPPYQWEPLFIENVGRFVEGRPLLNVVDRAAGY